MVRRSASVPAYRLHKQSGQAIVTLNDGRGGRKDFLLGPYGTRESRAEYNRRIDEWEAAGRQLPRSIAQAAATLSVNELLEAYFTFAQEYYRSPDGQPTNEVKNLRWIIRRMRLLYGETVAADFDGLALDALRGKMIAEGLARTRINKDVDRVKRIFKWAVPRKLVPLATYQELETVENLRAGRSAARETEPVRPVAEAVVEETLPHVSGQIAAMARLQLLTGMRPGEVVVMRGLDLDMGGPVWFYRPGSDRGRHGAHKNAYRGQDRVIAIGPRAQEVLRPWLRLNVTEYLFRPRDARASFDAERRAKRKSKVPPSQAKRKPKRRPKKTPGERYLTSSYAHAIDVGCSVAHALRCEACRRQETNGRKEDQVTWLKRIRTCPGLVAFAWHPNQLRHTKATEIRREAGIDAARAVLGHRSPAITETYAELDKSKAAEIMERFG